jgi:hypothetical protein
LEANPNLKQLKLKFARANSQWFKEITKPKVTEKRLTQRAKKGTRFLDESLHVQEQMHIFSRRVLTAQEAERKRISLTPWMLRERSARPSGMFS